MKIVIVDKRTGLFGFVLRRLYGIPKLQEVK